MSKHLHFDAQVLKTLFSFISSQYVLKRNTSIDPECFGIPSKELVDTLHTKLNQYHSPELKRGLDELCKELHQTDSLPVFPLIFRFADSMIERYNEKFHFSYRHCDVWRDVTMEMDEEYLVVAKAVMEDCKRQITSRSTFSWSYCIEHDNYRLSRMLCRDQGVSDNHFHLRGSSPYYYVSWVMLMNDFRNVVSEDYIRAIEKKRLKAMMIRSAVNIEDPMHVMRMKAAAIRLYLFAYMTKSFVYFEDELISCSAIKCLRLKHKGESCEECSHKDTFSLEDLAKFIYANPQYKTMYWEFWNKVLHKQLMKLLCSDDLPIDTGVHLQHCVDMLRFQHGVIVSSDYATPPATTHQNNHYPELAGERFILYNSMRYIYEHNENSVNIERLLYLYMLMKNKFRSEMVQSNQLSGFDNFARYQSRKDWFIPWSDESEKRLAEATVESILDGPKMCCVEFRISPTYADAPDVDLCAENARMIRLYDAAIEKALHDLETKDYECNRNFFYTYHFGKKDENTEYDHITCRSQQLREIIEQQADSILIMRQLYQEEAKRIHGIDACSNEMHCRPEVFGSVFRLLQFYEKPAPETKLRQLQATYHVGEDNYDIVDGLRAIHEAILFLGLRSGSRLGHATMLGMPSKYYYEQKKKTITMPRQYFLDNVVWMYYFIQNNFIVFPGVANILNYLKDKFLESFSYVYEESDAKKSSCDIYVYYLSWLLRGDAPELYCNGKFEMPKDNMERHKICESDDEMETARKHQGACQLYYRYHYDAKVKQRGMSPVTETVSDLFVETVEILQKEMQRQISIEGIAIETNPSSNVLISMLTDYSQHPITTFFDRGFSDAPNFHQLNVSINTDDKSVFSTSISNEYAYLAFYLENAKNSEGQLIYSRYEIFEWLDAIRKSGNEQAFDEIGF